MMRFTRAAILRIFTVTSLFLVVSTLASGQHPVVPPPHPAPPVHVYAPPSYHAPIMPTPTVRPPISYAPVSRPLRSAPLPSAGLYRSSIVLPPVHPIRPIHRVPPIFIVYTQPFFPVEPFWSNSFCWDASCDWFWPWAPGYASVSTSTPVNYVMQAPETQIDVYGDERREDFPQLYLKDGTILNVTDYWVVDNQLHFKIIEETGMKPVEHAIPFEELDLQATVDANTRRGFRFLLRNEPFEQYVRDHPEVPPVAVPPQ